MRFLAALDLRLLRLLRTRGHSPPVEAVAINLDIEPAEKPEQVLWVDPTHPHGGV